MNSSWKIFCLHESINFLIDAGTTKRKELHGKETAQALSGAWTLPPVDIKLHAYHLKFSCDVETYNDFVLLMEARLDDEIAVAKMDLFLIPNKLVKASVSPCGQVYLKSEKVCINFFLKVSNCELLPLYFSF